jgi:hypothetical protein
MIHNPTRLAEVLTEIADWPLDRRRAYISEIEAAFGIEAAEQIRKGLAALWETRGKK